MTHVLRLDCQFYPRVALVPGVTDSDKPLKRKHLESIVLNDTDTPSRKIVCTYKEGTTQGDSSKTADLLNIAQLLTARE